MSRPTSKRWKNHILGGLVFLALLGALNAVLHQRIWRPSSWGTIPAKMAAYEADPQRFDVVFLGDSRTYCAMHPEVLDPLLEVRSVNLSRWAHWFLTQVPQFEDLVETLPPGATVVWSVGHQNFLPNEDPELRTTYPIGVRNAARYMSWGVPWSELRQNVLVFNPLTQFVGRGKQWRSMIDDQLAPVVYRSQPTSPSPAPPTSPSGSAAPVTNATPPALTPADVAERLAQERASPHVARCEVRLEGGRATSLESYRKGGGYWRIELDRPFFRAKQRAAASKLRGTPPPTDLSADPIHWKAFLAILELCQQKQVRLVVNELEEAPHQYPTAAHKRAWRRFMRERVQPEVERRGFPYVRVEFDRLRDEHYFDYNHLNSEGVRAYSRLLVPALRPHLSD